MDVTVPKAMALNYVSCNNFGLSHVLIPFLKEA